MKNLLLVFTSLLFIVTTEAQTTGDYRSIATGDWNTVTTWEHFDGVSWVPAVVPPAYTDGLITITSPYTVTINNATTVDQLTVDAGAALVISAATTISDGTGTDLTVNGQLQIQAALTGGGSSNIFGSMSWTAGTITSMLTNEGTGVMTISGAAAKALNDSMVNNGTINWNAGNLDFNGGTIINNAIMNNGFDGVMTNTSGTNQFNNSGTFSKTAGVTTNTSIAIPMTNSGTIQVNSGVLIKTTNILSNSGTINIALNSEFRTNNLFVINAGSNFTGSGTITFANLVTNNIAVNFPATLLYMQVGGSNVSGAGSFTINGVMSWTGGTLGVLTNVPATGVINASSVTSKTLSNTLTNDGIINWLGGSINFVNGRLFNNATIDVKFDGNNMSNLGGVNQLTNSGLILKSAGTGSNSIILPFTNTGTITVNSGTLVSAGTLNLNTGTILSGTGTFGIDGTVNVNIPMNIPASLTIRKAVGTTAGTQTFTINGMMSWTGGSLGSPFVIMSGATLSLSSGSRALFSTLTNNGIINWTTGNIDFVNGTLNNAGSMNNSFDGSIYNISGTNLFNNTGTFTKIAGAITSSNIGIPMINSGTINVNFGTLQYQGTGLSNTGVINIASGRTFSNIGTLTLQPGTSITGTGNLQLGGVTQFTSNLTTPTGMTLFALPGSTTFGAGTVTVNSVMNWSGGSISAAFMLPASATLNASGSPKSLYSSMTNNGTMNWTAGDIIFNDGTLLNNGIIDQSFDGRMDVSGGTNQFTNTGTFRKTAGGATSTFLVPVTNTGTMEGGNGISFTSSFSNTGTISPGRPVGLMTVTSPVSPVLTATSNLHIHMLDGSGAGVGHDQLVLNQDLALDGTLTVTDLAATPAGTYVIVQLTSGTITGNFTTVVIPATYTLSISATTVVLLKSTLPLNWISFTGQHSADKNILNWVTDNEYSVERFEIERSVDGRSFVKIGEVASKSAHLSKQYQFEDVSMHASTNYYRLKQLDIDGKFEYSKTIVVRSNNNITQEIKIFPNPSKGNTTIIIPEKYLSGNIYVRSLGGQLIREFTRVSESTLLLQLPGGIYFIQFKKGQESVIKQLIIK